MSLASGAIVKLRKNIHVKFLYLSEKYCQVLCKSYYPILTARCESEINSEFHLKKKKKKVGRAPLPGQNGLGLAEDRAQEKGTAVGH